MKNPNFNDNRAAVYSIVTPAYNEEKNIPIMVEKIAAVMSTIDENWELIFINDGSSDRTLKNIKQAVQKDRRIKYIHFSRNFGHQAALTAGLDHASGDAIITMDCDLQDPPEIIPEMIEKWKAGADIVYARRFHREDTFLKKYTALLYYKILDKFSDTEIPRNVGDFRLIDKIVLERLTGMREKSRYLRGMVAWLGFTSDFVEFDRPGRIHGTTFYSWRKMFRLGLDGLLNFSSLPLKAGLFIGFSSIVIGFLFLAYMFGDIIFNNTIYQLYKFLVVIIFIFMGIQFISIWIIGEYIGKIYDESRNRPTYIIKKTGNLELNEHIDAKQ